MIEIKRVEIGVKTCTARVSIAPGAPLYTSEDLEATTRVYRLLPHIIEHSCIGDAGDLFRDCMGDTEIAHLLEHVTVELLAQTGMAGEITSGRTYVDPNDNHLADVSVSCTDDVLTVSALQSAAWILNWAYTGGKEPKPDVEAIVAGLRGLIDSIGDEPAKEYAEKVQKECELELDKKRESALNAALAEREELARQAKAAAEAEAAARLAAERQAASISATEAATVSVPHVGETTDVAPTSNAGDVYPLEEELTEAADLPAEEEATNEVTGDVVTEDQAAEVVETVVDEAQEPEEILDFVQAYDLDDISPEAAQAAVDTLSTMPIEDDLVIEEEPQAEVLSQAVEETAIQEAFEPARPQESFASRIMSMFHKSEATVEPAQKGNYWNGVPVAEFEQIEEPEVKEDVAAPVVDEADLEPEKVITEAAVEAVVPEVADEPLSENSPEETSVITAEPEETTHIDSSATATVVIPALSEKLAQDEIGAEESPSFEQPNEEVLEPAATVEETTNLDEAEETDVEVVDSAVIEEATESDETVADALVQEEAVEEAATQEDVQEELVDENVQEKDEQEVESEIDPYVSRLESIPAPHRVR